MAGAAPSYPCPACGFLTMDEPPGSYDICTICGWEDDLVQLREPRYAGGANHESLVDAQAQVIRELPLDVTSVDGFARDPSWRPVRDDDAAPRGQVDSTGYYYWKK